MDKSDTTEKIISTIAKKHCIRIASGLKLRIPLELFFSIVKFCCLDLQDFQLWFNLRPVCHFLREVIERYRVQPHRRKFARFCCTCKGPWNCQDYRTQRELLLTYDRTLPMFCFRGFDPADSSKIVMEIGLGDTRSEERMNDIREAAEMLVTVEPSAGKSKDDQENKLSRGYLVPGMVKVEEYLEFDREPKLTISYDWKRLFLAKCHADRDSDKVFEDLNI